MYVKMAIGKMRVLIVGLNLLTVLHLAAGTCVLESEFGFILNCNFKKSGLFRVRNLGGLKAHFGLGFSLGDELGFAESLGNLEGNRRRALNYKTGFIEKVGVVSPNIVSPRTALSHSRTLNQNASLMTEVSFLPLGVPTFRPIPKITNNLLRRNDVILNEEITNKRMTDLYFKPENTKEQVNAINLTTPIRIQQFLNEEQIMYNALKNTSTNMQNKIKLNLPHTNFDKNEMQKYERENNEGEQFNTKATKPKSSLTKKSSIQTSKVMNAPKEYYPSGYDKNFDDNFKSKVDLPPTDFTCTEQKYFPGLYANLDLGCMVFHVCAITDGGIIMKSFLCPESTLFDQSILKCNWWFYVDCNNSTYDSNIPISKSYQLMKSLSYFSNFTKTQSVQESSQKM